MPLPLPQRERLRSFAFANESLSRRIPFADCDVGNRTARLPNRENQGRTGVGALTWRSLQSGVKRKNRELAGFSRDIAETASRFLWRSDCVAERGGFEPSVRFCHAKSRRV